MRSLVPLVPEYICPKCGHFNPAPRSRHQQASPSTPSSRLPQPNFLAVSPVGDDDDETTSHNSRSVSRGRPSRGAEGSNVGDADASQDSISGVMDVDQ